MEIYGTGTLQITKDATIFNDSFTQHSDSLNFQKQYDQWEKKLRYCNI